jgi:hypothetical protein
MCGSCIFQFFQRYILCLSHSHALGEHMLKRRRTQKLKRNVIYSTATRRRIMLRGLHKKIIWRRRMFAMQQMEAQDTIPAGN